MSITCCHGQSGGSDYHAFANATSLAILFFLLAVPKGRGQGDDPRKAVGAESSFRWAKTISELVIYVFRFAIGRSKTEATKLK